jgi:hypothetical protein
MDETINPEVGPDLAKFFNMFIEMLLDPTVSKFGRDNVLTLLTRNVPRDEWKGATNERVLKFMELKGIERLLSLGSRTFDVERSPIPISVNTRANVAVCLACVSKNIQPQAKRWTFSKSQKIGIFEYFYK